MRFVRVAALAALPSLALFTANAAAATGCWYPNEAKAAQLRDFQIRLMVGTLQCRSKNSAAVELYNAFITKQRGLLDSNAQVLKTRFLRESGADAQRAYDRYATALANGNSANSDSADHCAKVDTLVRTATAASQPDLLILAQSMSTAPASEACPPSNYVLAEAKAVEAPAAATTAPAPVEAVAAAAAPEATVQPAVATDAPLTPPEPAKAVEAPKVEPAVVPAAAPAPASREDALQAAIVALQSATAALQAASASATTADAKPDPAPKQAQAVVIKVQDAPVVPPKEIVEE